MACSTKGVVEFPDGSVLVFDYVINVTNLGGDNSTNVTLLEYTWGLSHHNSYRMQCGL